MGFFDFFRKPKEPEKTQRWEEFGSYASVFRPFGADAFKSQTVRDCIRPLADYSAKATARSTNKRIERLLNERPNMYQSGYAFINKVRTKLELNNVAFIMISRDERLKVAGFYPIPYLEFEAVEYNNGLFVRFNLAGGRRLTVSWNDLVVLRKDYNRSDISGDTPDSIRGVLELLNTSNQAVGNALKSTSNLRGIVKSTKAILSPEAVKQQKEDFVKSYLGLENSGGIASLDATMEFTPINMSPMVADFEQMKTFREDVYRAFGVNDNVIMSRMTEAELESFYKSKIEPFLVQLSMEMTSKVFTDRERAAGAEIVYESNRLQFASMATKISVFKEVVLYGGMTINEWRRGCNLLPIDGGDELIRRLDADKVEDTPVTESEEDDNAS